MQVPYGQLNEVVLDEKKNVSFKFAPSNETKKQLETVQNKFNDFIKYMASFEKIYGRSFEYDFELCEMIFILMVGNHYLSDDILNCFTIDDEYSNGYNEWIYYPKEMIWKVNGETTVPVMLPKGFTTFHKD